MLTFVMEFDPETINAELAATSCKKCGHIGAGMTFTFTEGPHFARLNCNRCRAFIEWVSLPRLAAAKPKRRKSRKKLRDLGDRCEICLRHRDELPQPEQLQVHHALEVVADEGTDDDENLRVYCSACHAMVNWVRTYFGHYHPAVPSSRADVDAEADIDAGAGLF